MNRSHENMLNAHHLERRFLQMIGVLAFLLLIPELAQAQTAMPWDNFTCMLAKQLGGNAIKWMAVIAVALAGLMYGLGELAGPFQKTLQIAAGFSIALGAVAVVSMMFGAGPGNSC